MKVFGVCVLLFTVARSQLNPGNVNTVCLNVVNSLDCRRFDYKPICASDGTQFSTECEFAKAHCLDANLKVVNEGRCAGGATTTQAMTTAGATQGTVVTAATSGPVTMTIPPDQTVTQTIPPDVITSAPPAMMTTDIYLTAVCNQVVNTPCGTESNPLCATDGKTYLNYCEFAKSRCYLTALQIAYTGQCSGTDTFPPLTTAARTTPPPSVLDIICRTLEQVTCADDGKQVCASNGVAYASACDFEKAKCQDRMLTVDAC
ncbi:hypothetical protein V1264_021746 [Littorina saxatilis]|uniref:Kazal-like domain-containing protein n=2 Tax=Littorina saxatilis TaxID=31220 RepID=A0AAN9AJ22_9CAEN